MGIAQKSPLGTMSPGGASTMLRTPLVAAAVLLFVIWSLLALDSYTKSTQTTIVFKNGTIRPGPITNDAVPSFAAEVPTEEPKVDTPPAGLETIPQDSSITELTTPVSDRPVILYAYSDSNFARVNLKFFIAHGLHGAADFVFILNGESDAKSWIPVKDNVKVIQRPNDCYDLGAYSEVLQKDDFYKGYKKFIMMNASIRGPFAPSWSNMCWMDMYLGKITDEVKLVGMSSNCWPTFHVQSMIWATDIIGIEVLLHPSEQVLDFFSKNPIKLPPPKDPSSYSLDTTYPIDPTLPAASLTPSPETPRVHQAPGINGCFHNWDSAVAAEVSSTSVIKAAGYKVDVLMAAYHGQKGYDKEISCEKNQDVLFEGKYWGTNVHVFETGFVKSHRGADNVGLMKHTEWMAGRNYSSWDFCHSA